MEVQQRKNTVEKERNKHMNLTVVKRHEMKEKFWTEKKRELQEQIKTRKEMQNLRREDVQENLAIYTTVKVKISWGGDHKFFNFLQEREHEKRFQEYLDKTRKIKEWKDKARKEIV